jgi:hypothetical protein
MLGCIFVVIACSVVGLIYGRTLNELSLGPSVIYLDPFYFTVDLLGDTKDLSYCEKVFDIYGGEQEVVFVVSNYFDDEHQNKQDTTYNISIANSNAESKYQATLYLMGDENEAITTETVKLMGYETPIGGTVSQSKSNLVKESEEHDATYVISFPALTEGEEKVVVTVQTTCPYAKQLIMIFNIHAEPILAEPDVVEPELPDVDMGEPAVQDTIM